MRNRKGKKGFTLIELLIVIAIIGILAAILIPNLLRARRVAVDRAAQGYAQNLYTAGNAYLAEHLNVAVADIVPTDCAAGWDVSAAGQYVVNAPSFSVTSCTIVAAAEDFDIAIAYTGGVLNTVDFPN